MTFSTLETSSIESGGNIVIVTAFNIVSIVSNFLLLAYLQRNLEARIFTTGNKWLLAVPRQDVDVFLVGVLSYQHARLVRRRARVPYPDCSVH